MGEIAYMSKINYEEIMDSMEWSRTIKLVSEWEEGENFEFKDNNDLDNLEKLLKLSHHYEIEARKTAEYMSQYECSIICMNLYSYIVYIAKHGSIHNTIHNKDALHLYALEAIRILQYGTHREEDEVEYSNNQMMLLLRQIENMVLIREIAKRMKAGMILKPKEIVFRNGIKLAEEDQYFIDIFGKNFSGKGMRLRMAHDTTHFLHESYKNKSAFIRFLQSLVTGINTKYNLKVVKGTYFEFLPRMEKDNVEFESYSNFLISLIRRILFTKDFMKEQENKIVSIYNSDVIRKTQIPEEMIFFPQFKRWKIEDEEKIDLFQTPIVKINSDYYATCYAICGDSLNSWIERELKNNCETSIWKQEFLHQVEIQFEEEVNDFMIKNGYQSGNIKQNGEWVLKNKNLQSIKLPLKLSGECDVFAINEKSKKIFLLECKRLHDAVSSNDSLKTMENVRKRVLREFIPKLIKKNEEIKKYIEQKYPEYVFCSAVVTDVNFPIYIPEGRVYKPYNNIIYCCFNSLQNYIEKAVFPKNAIFTRSKQ